METINTGLLLKTLVLTLLISLSTNVFAADVVIDQKKPDLIKIKQLIDNGNASQALEQMEPFADKNIGDIEFDYLYGMAAADSGEAVKAIFALERVTTQKPNHAGARLELARAFYINGETLKAKLEFEAVLELNPPESTKKIIQDYLDRINDDQDLQNKPWIATVALALGSDSNANSATSDASFLGFNLDSESKATASTYSQLKVGGIYGLQIVKNHDLLFSANLNNRSNFDASFADTNNVGLGVTMSHSLTTAQFNYGITYNDVQVDGSSSNNILAFNASVQNLQPNGESNAIFLRYATVRYTTLTTQDVDQLLVGLTNTSNIGQDKQNQYTLASVFGADSGLTSNSSSSKLIIGASASANFISNRQLSWNTGVGFQINPYDNKAVGNTSRTDNSLSYHLKANYKFNNAWQANVGLTGNVNKSTVSLFQYDKNAFYGEAVWTY